MNNKIVSEYLEDKSRYCDWLLLAQSIDSVNCLLFDGGLFENSNLWNVSLTFHHGSSIYTREASVKLSPTPPARREARKTCTLGFSLKLLMANVLSL